MWIPTTESPEVLEEVLFADTDGAVYLGYYYCDGLFYGNDDGIRHNIVYWMSIPLLVEQDDESRMGELNGTLLS